MSVKPEPKKKQSMCISINDDRDMASRENGGQKRDGPVSVLQFHQNWFNCSPITPNFFNNLAYIRGVYEVV